MQTIPKHRSPKTASVLHVAGGQDFASLLVEFVVEHWPRQQWPEALIFLPNRRSVRQVRDAFLAQIGEGSAFLPGMVPLADIEPASLLLLQGIRRERTPAPIMPTAQRRMLLAKQIELFFVAQGQVCSTRYALDMADALAQLFDESVRYGVDMRDLRYLVPDMFSAYWQQSLAFLAIVFQHWPRIEQGYGMISHQQALVEALQDVTTAWEAEPPTFPVMIAGSTASQPATSRLLHAVANAPQGVVLLPSSGTLDSAYEEAIAPGHPLYHVRAFTRGLSDMPKDVSNTRNSNAHYLTEAFRPIGSGEISVLQMPEHLVPIECSDEWEEARVVSLIVRDKLQSSHMKVMVVSPDRATLTRVGVALMRWGIVADSSSANRLSDHPFMRWVQLLLAMVETRAGALEALAFFQHPLSFADNDTLHDYLVSRVDAAYARGFARSRSMSLLSRILLADAPAEYIPLLTTFIESLRVLSQHEQRPAAIDAWISAVRACAACCGADSALDDTLDGLLQTVAGQGARDIVGVEAFLLLLEHVCDVPWFSVREGRVHPNVFLHTPIEARLQSADCVILAGLNEGVWPRLPSSPWLNQAMRATLTLPTHEHELSLQGHDFLMLASHACVYLTRAERMQQAIATPSRWWQRLMLFHAGDTLPEQHQQIAAQYRGWARAMDEAQDYVPSLPPKPMPPIEARPRSLRATQMEELLFNPYAVYARSVLELEPLDGIDLDLDASLLGTMMHALLEQVGNAEADAPDDVILRLIDDTLQRHTQSGRVQILWRERLLRGLQFFLTEHRRRLPLLESCKSEVTLGFAMTVAGGHVIFRGRADRVEKHRNGMRQVIDFKTGGSGLTEKKMMTGEAPQLPLYHMAMVQEQHGESFVAHLGEAAFAYWVMPHGADSGEIIETPVLSQEEAALILERYQTVVQHALFTDAAMLYAPIHRSDGRYSYSALARAAEWGGADSDESH